MARSVEVAKNFTSDAFEGSILVGHDTFVGGKDDDTKLAGGEDGVGELLEVLEGEIEAGGDDTALVDATVQVDDNLS